MTGTSALITDFYELTMMHGYYMEHHDSKAVFDMFYRTNPFQGGYTIFTGIEELIDKLESLSFSAGDIEYLRSLGIFDAGFLEYLRDYRFHGDVYAFDEGTPAFPGEPLIRVESDLMDAQLVETLLLNSVNFETLIATKASRMVNALKGHGREWSAFCITCGLHRRDFFHEQHVRRQEIRNPSSRYNGPFMGNELRFGGRGVQEVRRDLSR